MSRMVAIQSGAVRLSAGRCKSPCECSAASGRAARVTRQPRSSSVTGGRSTRGHAFPVAGSLFASRRPRGPIRNSHQETGELLDLKESRLMPVRSRIQ